ncbi:threonine-phosphate decarboxylase [Litchfieldella qijiaojingensis]|uniref:threonine-phosphate decarboxylase n=1 Tax=Litchfieldella qijiaojingensis TaxID=980347 RepID=A0ABQ2YGW5_9GAMM|nr:threonine-phosphate decarboxylase CobD [Halomonas qijiaojingensis]GGX82538.1 threonine-phosphate decarboxylase [Halomonas qijiaojingensis]
MQWPSHGGRPKQVLSRFNLDEGRDVLDFSANINPLGPPAWLRERLVDELQGVAAYPDPDYGEVRRVIAEAEGISLSQVLPTNGGAEAIFLAAALCAGKRAVIVQPTFGEYARACSHYGLMVSDIHLDPLGFSLNESGAVNAMHEADVVFLCRPNNPTGTLVECALIERMLEAGKRRGSNLVVDEAFVDFLADPAERLTSLLERHSNLILLRSLTKLYAIPGLRLGYLLASPETVRRVAAVQMPWSVNALAAALVEPLLSDEGFVTCTHAWLQEELPRMSEALAALGFQVVPSRVNFLLFQDARRPGETDALFEFLLRKRVLARHTHNFPGLDGAWLRVAIRSASDNDCLIEALTAWRQQE